MARDRRMAASPCRIALVVLLSALPAAQGRAAEPAGATAAGPAVAATASLDQLARQVDRAESIRAIKTLQRSFAQYMQVGLWTDLGALYAREGTLTFEGNVLKGGAAIAASLRKLHGVAGEGGKDGLPPGVLHTGLIDQPLVNLSVDGEHGKGRWYGLFFQGDGKGGASFQGGIYENDYVREGGKWTIAASHFHPQYAGPYESGWTNWKGEDLGYVPFHFTNDQTGIPIPPATGPAPKTSATAAALQKRIAVLNEEDKVRNLQAAYGYYVNRKMWDDVVDLFADKSAVEIGGVGIYDGKAGVRRAMERMGPAGLVHGELNDRPQFDTVVTIAPGGHEAHARGIEMGMLGQADKGTAYWEINVYDNRFVKEGGLWKIREMRIFQLMRTDYALGWGKSRIVETAPKGRLAPDRPVPAADVGKQDRIIPAFAAANPVTGKPIMAPTGMKLVATTPLTGAIATAPAPKPAPLAELARRLAVSTAYDGAENVSTAYGNYIDDSQWRDMGAIFGKNGAKQKPFVGYYKGVERITQVVINDYGEPRTKPRASIAFHWRIQPVINVASDGRSANVRTYLFHPNTSKVPNSFAPGLSTGMYQDQMVIEDGIWRIWNLTLDEPYVQTAGWKGGWSGAKDRPPGQKPRDNPLLKSYPPDIPISIMGKREEHFLGGSGDLIEWPGILPMWFPYTNPVSGRAPENFIADCAPCAQAPDLSMAKHGYLLPPTGPVPDGN